VCHDLLEHVIIDAERSPRICFGHGTVHDSIDLWYIEDICVHNSHRVVPSLVIVQTRSNRQDIRTDGLVHLSSYGVDLLREFWSACL
jgi:hypothetical protein